MSRLAAVGTRQLLPDATILRCRTAGREISRRLSGIEQVTAFAARAADQARQPFGWRGSALASGFAGHALVHTQTAQVMGSSAGPALNDARQSIQAAAADTREGALNNASLFSGVAGFATALRVTAAVEPRFQVSLDRLDARLSDLVIEQAAPVRERGSRADDYDLISGDAGVLLYLSAMPCPSGPIAAARDHLVARFVSLVGRDTSSLFESFTIFPESYPVDSYAEIFPTGYVNTGLSHGLPGVLLALAAAFKAGCDVSGLRDCIELLIGWLLEIRSPNGWGQGVRPSAEQPTSNDDTTMFAWCYGTPGVAVALTSGSEALGDTASFEAAVSVFEHGLEAYSAAPIPDMSATFCHGQAGVLACAADVARRGSTGAIDALPTLVERLLDSLDLGLPLGVHDQETRGAFVDDPGLLTGSAGVSLVLLSLDPAPSDSLSPFLGRF